MIPDKAAGNPTPETLSVRRKERVTENKVGNRFQRCVTFLAPLHPTRAVPRQNLVETRTVFCNPLLVESTYFDFLVPQHPFKMIETASNGCTEPRSFPISKASSDSLMGHSIPYRQFPHFDCGSETRSSHSRRPLRASAGYRGYHGQVDDCRQFSGIDLQLRRQAADNIEYISGLHITVLIDCGYPVKIRGEPLHHPVHIRRGGPFVLLKLAGQRMAKTQCFRVKHHAGDLQAIYAAHFATAVSGIAQNGMTE